MRQKYTRRLPQPRVSQELFDKVKKVAETQELNISDVVRLALEDYCNPPEVFGVPIVGEIKDNHVVFYPGVKQYLKVEPAGGGA